MDYSSTYTKTGRGMRAVIKKLPENAGKVLSVIDKIITGEEIFSKTKKMKEKDFEAAMSWLLDRGHIKVVGTDQFAQSIWEPPSKDAFKISEISFDQFDEHAKNSKEINTTDGSNDEIKTNEHSAAPAQAKQKQAATSALDYYKKEKNKIEKKDITEQKQQERKNESEKEKIAKIKRYDEAKKEARIKAKELARKKEEEDAKLKAKVEKEIRIKEEEEALEIKKEEEAVRKREEQEAKAKDKAEKEEAKRKAKAEKEEEAVRKRESQEAKDKNKEKKEEAKRKAKAEKEEARFRAKVEKEEAKLKAKAAKTKASRKNSNVKSTKRSNKKQYSYFFKSIKYLFISAVTVPILLLLAAQFLNLYFLIAPIKKIAEIALQDQVNIKAIHASIIPRPHLALDGFILGESQTVKAQKVRIYPNLSTLKNKINTISKAPYDISSVEIDDLTISQQELTNINIWAQHAKNHNSLKINKILLNEATVMLNSAETLIVNGDVLLNKNNEFNSATITSKDQRLTLSITGSTKHYRVNIKGQNWQLPISPNPKFTYLDATGSIKNNILTLSSIEGSIYNGKVKANLITNLNENWATQGSFDLTRIELTNIAQDIQYNTAVEGKLEASGDFNFNFNKATNKIEALKVKTNFKVDNGLVKKIDLIEAMRSGRANGATPFTILSGNASLNNNQYQFKNVLLQDKQLRAKGSLNISASKTLSGNISSRIATKRNAINSRFRITGTTERVNLVN